MSDESAAANISKIFVDGKEFTQMPEDLFIPPDALEILLDSFSGPLDLLLYLIRKQNIDILNIPIVRITQQYLRYIELMECRRLELAAEYLLMAAMLAEIKARLLLPVSSDADEEEEDPRMALVRQLQAYEQVKEAALLLDTLPRQERDYFAVHIQPDEIQTIILQPDVSLNELLAAMQGLMQKEQHTVHHQIEREAMSVRERMSQVLYLLEQHASRELTQLFTEEEGRAGLVVSLLAVLEFARQAFVILTQIEPFSPLHLRAA
jgi:segregation and condensation protein A